jgi:GcrA cell cycle regulator
MQSFSWPPEHSAALREHVTRGLSYAEAVAAINHRFGTAYTRLAAISRGKRMKLAAPPRLERGPSFVPRSQRLPKAKSGKKTGEKSGALPAGGAADATPVPPVAAAPPKLRCVGVSPRLVSLIDLEPGQCHYPYGGDREGEAITFCGHPCFRGSVYCAPHFHLTRGPALEDDRPAGPVVLRLVAAA